METLRLAFIGAGNVAWHLAPALDNAGYTVSGVYSRNRADAIALTKRLYQAEVLGPGDLIKNDPDLIFITVADAAIPEIVNTFQWPEDAVIIHTSGTTPLSVLSGYHPKSGVFYPLQTFTKGKKVSFESVPVFLEASDPVVLKTLRSLAGSITKKVYEADSANRQVLHTAAVFACNFTNHMMAIASRLAKTSGIPEAVLHPLIIETINKSLELGPEKAQTGPARRHDLSILDQHMETLAAHPEWAEIYKIISQNIIDTYPEG